MDLYRDTGRTPAFRYFLLATVLFIVTVAILVVTYHQLIYLKQHEQYLYNLRLKSSSLK